MANIVSVNLMLFLALSFLSISGSTHDSTFTFATPAATSPPLFTISPSPQSPQDLGDNAIFSHISLLAPILSHLGFNELATAAPSLSGDSSAACSGPYTIFAPSDFSVRTCISCSVPSLLIEHMVPGLFSIDYLRKLTFGTKIETLSPGRCITVTASTNDHKNSTVHKVFIGGVEITHPDLFNNGLIIIHGLQGNISPLSPFSCDVERMTSLSFPFHYDRNHNNQLPPPPNGTALMRFMLRDAILRLRNNDFTVLSIAMRIKYPELVTLNNVTIFALDDVSIFTGSYSYINNVRYHIVPNQFLTTSDLEKLPVGTTLTTLDRGQSLVVTTAGAGGGGMRGQMRINYVRIKVAEVVRNLKIIVHSIYLPLPHVHTTAGVSDAILGGGNVHQSPISTSALSPTSMTSTGAEGMDIAACNALDERGGCGLMSPVSHVTTDLIKPPIAPVPEIKDHHGL